MIMLLIKSIILQKFIEQAEPILTEDSNHTASTYYLDKKSKGYFLAYVKIS